MAGPYEFRGVQDLVSAIAGPPDTTAFTQRLGQNYRAQEAGWDADRAREEASMAQLQRIARAGLGDTVRGFYNGTGTQGDLAAALLSASSTPNLRNLGALELPGVADLNTEAQTALRAGDYPRYNALNAGVQGKPFEPVVDLGDVLVQSGAPLGSAMVPTPAAAARIEATQASAAGKREWDDARIATELARQETEGARREKIAAPAVVAPVKADGTRAEPVVVAEPSLEPVLVDPANPLAGVIGPPANPDQPPAGARQAADGNWYVPDPARPGKWLQWTP